MDKDLSTRPFWPPEDLAWWRNEARGLVVDTARFKTGPRGRKLYAHVTGDNMEALRLFARVFSRRLQTVRTRPHFDLPEDALQALFDLGVPQVTSRQVAETARKLVAR